MTLHLDNFNFLFFFLQHLSAVRELASMSNLSDSDCRQLAQSSQMRTAIGLANSRDVDLRLFTPPPPLPETITSRPALVQLGDLLSELATVSPGQGEEVDECLRRTTEVALNRHAASDEALLRDDDLDSAFGRDSHHFPRIPRKRYSERSVVEFCLQALLSHSTLRSRCAAMVVHGVLPLLQKTLNDYPDSPTLNSLVGKVLANVCLYEENHSALFSSGWVGILAAWRRQPNLLFQLPAMKALCNLDKDFFGGAVYRPGVYLLLPEQRCVRHLNELSNWGVDVVFIHGLLGGVFYSWRQRDEANEKGWYETDVVSTKNYSYCWPKDWLADVSDRVRVIGIDFDTYLSRWGQTCPTESFKASLEERSEEIRQKLVDAGVGRGGRPVIFVGHSMGGLIAKRMLVTAAASSDPDVRALSDACRGVVFYGTPHLGSRIAKMNSYTKYFFFPSTEVCDLEAGSPRLVDLHLSFLEMIERKGSKIDVVSFGETRATPYLGLDLLFVPRESAHPGVGQHYEVAVNHMNVCKPSSRDSILFRKLRRLIWLALDEATPFE